MKVTKRRYWMLQARLQNRCSKEWTGYLRSLWIRPIIRDESGEWL